MSGMRGAVWFNALTGRAGAVTGLAPSVLVADAPIEGLAVRWISVVPNPDSAYPRARNGEFGIEEGAAVARAVRETPPGSAIAAIVDVPGQAFGWREEAQGLHRALAASVEAYAEARRAGRAVLALIVGKAISGAFLAHGLQASWIGALRDPGIEVHVMSESAVARVTRMPREEVARIATVVPATARDIESFARLGAVDALFEVRDPLAPSSGELQAVRHAIAVAIEDSHVIAREPRARLDTALARTNRARSLDVRAALRGGWRA